MKKPNPVLWTCARCGFAMTSGTVPHIGQSCPWCKAIVTDEHAPESEAERMGRERAEAGHDGEANLNYST